MTGSHWYTSFHYREPHALESGMKRMAISPTSIWPQKPQYDSNRPSRSKRPLSVTEAPVNPACNAPDVSCIYLVLLIGDGIEGLSYWTANRVVTRIFRLCNDFSGIHYGDFLFLRPPSGFSSEFIHTGCLLIHVKHTTVCHYSGRSLIISPGYAKHQA